MFNSFGATNAVQFVDETTSLTEQIEEWKKLYSIVVLVSTFPAGGKKYSLFWCLLVSKSGQIGLTSPPT